jgi:hypothetical protein
MSAYAQVGGRPSTAATLIIGPGRGCVMATLRIVG